MSEVKKRSVAKWIIVPLILLLAAGICFYSAYIYYDNSIYKPLDSSQTGRKVDLSIKSGSTTNQITESLYSEGLIKDRNTFKVYLKLNNLDGKLKAGKYELSPGMNAAEIANKLVHGEIKKDTVKVTIPEGFEVKDIASAMEKAGLVKKEEFLSTAENMDFDYDFLKGLPKRPVRIEGYLFPDTYEFSKNATSEQIIKRMLERFNEVFDTDMRKKAADMNLSIDQVITMASIVEREARVAGERPMVAAVFYNRLKKKMRLESCATIQYALGERKEKLLYKDLEIKSPYNTYRNDGLPVGPIANPGKASIEAALNPSDVDYLFFVAKSDGSGAHAFSVNYGDFLKDKEKNKTN